MSFWRLIFTFLFCAYVYWFLELLFLFYLNVFFSLANMYLLGNSTEAYPFVADFNLFSNFGFNLTTQVLTNATKFILLLKWLYQLKYELNYA